MRLVLFAVLVILSGLCLLFQELLDFLICYTALRKGSIRMALKEYKPGTAFSGAVGTTFDVSSPAWRQRLRDKESVPNGNAEIDQLAAGGVLFNDMPPTALCWRTRS